MKITVVTVAYNAAATIGDTLASVAAQDHDDWEHLIIDGASTDDTLAVVAARAHPRLRVVSAPDRGLYDAMNKGFRLAQGELVGFLNADDFFCRTDALSRLSATAERSGADAVGAGIAIVAADDPRRAIRAYPAAGFRPWMVHIGRPPPHPGFYARRDAIARVGDFDAEMRIAADFDWLTRFFQVEGLSAAWIEQTLVAQRAGGASQTLGGVMQGRREMHAALKRRGLLASRALILGKYAVKLGQMARRPRDFPPEVGVAWFP